MPHAPVICRGEAGLSGLRNISWKGKAITGAMMISFIDKTVYWVDRCAAMLGNPGKSGEYNGQCEKFDPAKIEQAF